MLNIPQTKRGFDILVQSKISSMKASIELGNDALAEMYSRDIVRFIETVYNIRPHFFCGQKPQEYLRNLVS